MTRADGGGPSSDAAAVQMLTRWADGHRNHAELRGVLGLFATGITLVTAAASEVPQGITVNSFTSVSLEPPLVLVCVNKRAAIHQVILDSQSFVVSVLGAHQEHVARHFASHSRPRGHGELDVISWTPAPRTGCPVVLGALAWLECGLAEVYEGGDHSILLGSVQTIGQGTARDALLFFGGGYHRLERGEPEQ